MSNFLLFINDNILHHPCSRCRYPFISENNFIKKNCGDKTFSTWVDFLSQMYPSFMDCIYTWLVGIANIKYSNLKSEAEQKGWKANLLVGDLYGSQFCPYLDI